MAQKRKLGTDAVKPITVKEMHNTLGIRKGKVKQALKSSLAVVPGSAVPSAGPSADHSEAYERSSDSTRCSGRHCSHLLLETN